MARIKANIDGVTHWLTEAGYWHVDPNNAARFNDSYAHKEVSAINSRNRFLSGSDRIEPEITE